MAAVDSPKKPKISVIMAVKDGRKYLRQAIDSVLGQTFGDFEFIIIDDGSSDGTLPLIEIYSDPRIKLIINRNHLGLSASLNAGLNAARGEYIARMDADDVCLPERLEKQVRFLDQHPRIVVLGTGIRFIDEQGKTIQDVQMPLESGLIKWKLCFMNPIAHPSAMMRIAAVKQIGGYDQELICSQDYDLWWRLSAKNQLANLSDILVMLRQHSGQVTNAHRTEQFDFAIKINRKHLSALIGVPISEAASKNLLNNSFSTAKDARFSSYLLLGCLKKTCREARDKRSRRLIERDAVLKIVSIIEPYWLRPKSWLVLWRLILSSPVLAIRIVAGRLKNKRKTK